jgi:hypothetical protein
MKTSWLQSSETLVAASPRAVTVFVRHQGAWQIEPPGRHRLHESSKGVANIICCIQSRSGRRCPKARYARQTTQGFTQLRQCTRDRGLIAGLLETTLLLLRGREGFGAPSVHSPGRGQSSRRFRKSTGTRLRVNYASPAHAAMNCTQDRQRGGL